MKNIFFTLCLILIYQGSSAENILGFDSVGSEKQRRLESEYDKNINAKEMDEWLKELSKVPHHVGSLATKANADFLASLFNSWGFKVEIEEYHILIPTPKVLELDLISPSEYKASLNEESLTEDPSTYVRENLLPPYNAFSIDGKVEGELVFVNYGMPQDYEVLERYGIDVKGKIAIAKYGRSWRGIKPKLAGEKGAIATIIYSDPADDGYGKGDVYPKGPYKNDSGVQRGSVMDMPTYPGDVLTPGIGATKSAKRLKIENVETITKIPVLPISYRDALPLLSAMEGPVVPQEWRGGLPITYHLGPGPAKVRLNVQFNWENTVAYNVIARIEGTKFPDEWVIRGNHHDGWNHGAADPISGLVALLAEAKSVAMLANNGTKPLRTLIYAAWDAEEVGLIGSTEWAEHHADELQKHAVAYLNTDGNSRGFVNIGGSHVLERFFNQIMDEVKDPRMDITVKERKRAYLKINGDSEKKRKEAEKRNDLRINPLGSGSDYTPFLQHLGIASANIGFGGEGNGGSYHTLYDTYEHYTAWKDPGLVYGVSLAQVAGRATLRLSNSDRLPFEFKGFADNIGLYISELEELAENMRQDTKDRNNMINDGTYTAALDPNKTIIPPKIRQEVPYFNFSPLKNALSGLMESAEGFDQVAKSKNKSSKEINNLLYTIEQLMTREEGLPGRNWYRHYIYAPGFYTGYGVKTIPAVREAIEQRNYDEVEKQISLSAEVISKVTLRINRILGLMQ
ncbi:MAG TPA: transferrin receptor-like dimerization domain-containing protein [Woeseiaceae bacterium]|nr:transferrin receptor-like dimerization domain-containing protein [Woeseiaceae bacterium]|tara:strand:+ start:27615 stop:29831 length:2217 start_codon:yes stop_codon:yes gene_type:complete